MQCCVLLSLEDELDEHGLLGGLERDLILKDRSEELEEDGGHVAHFQRNWLVRVLNVALAWDWRWV